MERDIVDCVDGRRFRWGGFVLAVTLFQRLDDVSCCQGKGAREGWVTLKVKFEEAILSSTCLNGQVTRVSPSSLCQYRARPGRERETEKTDWIATLPSIVPTA